MGTVCFVSEDYWPLNTCLYVKDFKGNSPRFAYYLLRSIDFAHLNSGSAQPSLNRNFVHPVPILLPSRAEQDRIAALLGALDDKIELNRRMNETLEAMARAIFRDWFVEFGPTRAKMEGRAPTLAPELWSLFPDTLGEDGLPVGWRWGSLSDAVSINPREQLAAGQIAPYLDMAALPTRGPCADEPTMRPAGSGARYRENDTLLARITPCLENGKTAIVWGLGAYEVGWGSTEFIVLRAVPPYPPEFAYLLARHEDFRRHCIQAMSGTSGRQRVATDALHRFVWPSGSAAICGAFAQVVGPLFARIKGNAAENRTLAALRDLLLPRLMSGELRLRDAEALAEAVA
jgi:type I restriction enzyme S subunit